MLKAVLLSSVCGAALVAGGTALLWSDGSNIASFAFWQAAAEVVLAIPGEVIALALSDGANRWLYRGIAIVAAGVAAPAVAIATVAMATFLRLAVDGAGHARRSRERSGEGRRAIAKETAARPGRASTIGTLAKAVRAGAAQAIGHLAGPMRGDRELDLEGAPEGKIEKKSPSRRGRWLTRILPGWRRTQGARKEAAFDMLPTEDDLYPPSTDPLADLRQWYDFVRRAGSDGDPALVERAREIQDAIGDREREKLLDEEPMSGEYMLRMLSAWADYEEVGEAERDGQGWDREDDEGIAAAALDPTLLGEADEQEDARLDLESDDSFLDIDAMTAALGGDVEEEAEGDDADEGLAQDIQNALAPDDAGDDDITQGETPEARIADLLDRIVPAVTDIDTGADPVAEEELAQALETLDAETRQMEPEDLDALIVEYADKPQWQWLERNLTRLTELAPPEVEDDMSAQEDAPEAIGAWEGGEENDAIGGADLDPMAGAEGPEQGDDPALSAQSEAVEKGLPTDTAERDDGAEDRRPDAGKGGQDRSLGELEEVAACGDILTRWGYVAKGAGASEARLVHGVVQRDGAARRVIGVVHVLAMWRHDDGAERARVNLIFRHVPEGAWNLKKEDGARLVAKNGDFVEASDRLLTHLEGPKSQVIVHFYGPGAPEKLDEVLRDKIWLVSEVMTENRIREVMGQSL